jgi:hypothetical protein
MGEWYVVKSMQAERYAATVFFLYSKPNIFQFFARHLQLFCGLSLIEKLLNKFGSHLKEEKFSVRKGFNRVSVLNGSGRNNLLGHGVRRRVFVC